MIISLCDGVLKTGLVSVQLACVCCACGAAFKENLQGICLFS